MKAVKRPIPIEVVQFTLAAKPACVQARADGSYFVWNDLHKSEVNIKPGDYLNVTNPDDIYPIEEAVFAATYIVQDEPPASVLIGDVVTIPSGTLVHVAGLPFRTFRAVDVEGSAVNLDLALTALQAAEAVTR